MSIILVDRHERLSQMALDTQTPSSSLAVLFLFSETGSHGVALAHRNSLGRPSWPPTHRDPVAFAYPGIKGIQDHPCPQKEKFYVCEAHQHLQSPALPAELSEVSSNT